MVYTRDSAIVVCSSLGKGAPNKIEMPRADESGRGRLTPVGPPGENTKYLGECPRFNFHPMKNAVQINDSEAFAGKL
jgi:hypothetical protein